jgi:aryl-alcohol dehydrogenase-like predicted oxidoreductase
VQRDLGQEGFTRLVRYAYDRGIRFFETAESYGGMHKMLGIALKGLPRDSYQLMSKVTTRDGVSPQQKFDELRTLANAEYFDIMLLHWQHTATWPADTRRWQDAILEAESKKAVVSHGASVHGLPALRRVPGNEWLDVAMIRVNHKGKAMDAEEYNTQDPGNVPEVVEHVKQVRKEGMGIIAMKLVEFLLRAHAVASGHLGHQLIAVPRETLQSDAQHPVHLAVRLGGLEEANAAVVGMAHQARKPLLPEFALNLAAEAPCAERQTRDFHP